MPRRQTRERASRRKRVPGPLVSRLRRQWYPPRGGPARQLLVLWLAFVLGVAVLHLIAPYEGGSLYPQYAVILNMIMSDVGWTLWAALWAAIQAKISGIDYDYWGWATERWARAEAKLGSPEFKTWLAEVQA